jgi:hypothetical protein
MSKAHDTPGTAVLHILVERHRALLEDENGASTPEQALGRLLGVYLRFDRRKILAAAAEALQAAGCEEESDIIRHLFPNATHGTTH